MAEEKKLLQVLSNETPNDQGYVVLNGGVDWETRFKKNPQLLFGHDWSRSIGKVHNIRLENDAWVGELEFDGIGELSRETRDKYYAGTYRAVSISGAPTYVEQDGLKICTNFLVYEVSVVPLPSNPDCVSDFKDSEPIVEFSVLEDKAERIVKFSAEQNDLLTKYNQKMEKEKEKAKTEEFEAKKDAETVEAKADEPVKAAEEQETQTAEFEADKSKADILAKLPQWFRDFLGFGAKQLENEAKEDAEGIVKNESEAKTEGEVVSNEAKAEDKETFAAEKPKPEPRMFDGEAALKKEQTKFSTKMAEKKTLLEFMADGQGKAKFNAGARYFQQAQATGKFDSNSVEAEYLREFVSIAQNDPGFKAFMGNVKFDVNGQYAGTTTDALNRLTSFASGVNSMDFVTNSADLAKVMWLSLFYRQLFPEDSWVSRCGRVSGQGHAGVIWINSAIAPDIYFGKRAPLNVAGATYDDIAVGLAEYVFSTQPIVWQPATTDLFAYDALGLGTSEAMRLLTYKMHNYYIQQIAAAAPTGSQVKMSGASFASANMFPSNSSATGNLKKLSTADMLAAQAVFINQNYTMDPFKAVMIMPAAYFMQLQADSTVTNLLTKNAGVVRPNTIEYAGFLCEARSTTALYDTSTSKITDAELYCDGKVSDDGTIPSYTPPVLSGTMYDAAIGMIPEDIVIALGETNVHMQVDASNYGWKMSMDVRTGAGAGRKNGNGIVLVVPTVNA